MRLIFQKEKGEIKMATFNGFGFTETTTEEVEGVIQELTHYLKNHPLTEEEVAKILVQTMNLTAEISCELDEDDEQSVSRIRSHVEQIQQLIEASI